MRILYHFEVDMGIETDAVLKSFRIRKVLMIEQLAELLNRSLITARRFLKQHECFTSINKNARYYTLPTVPRFDSDGLWAHKGIFFSRNGNLRQTVIYLIERSPAGFSTSELEKMLGLADNSSFISTFKDLGNVRRDLFGAHARSGYVYFAKDPQIYQSQKTKRQTTIMSLPSDSDAVAILVELIKHPESSASDLTAFLADLGKCVDSLSIERLLVHHGL